MVLLGVVHYNVHILIKSDDDAFYPEINILVEPHRDTRSILKVSEDEVLSKRVKKNHKNCHGSTEHTVDMLSLKLIWLFGAYFFYLDVLHTLNRMVSPPLRPMTMTMSMTLTIAFDWKHRIIENYSIQVAS